MKKSTTKRALLMSILSMFLCFTMLVGTTFAWFTDEVKSGVNQIVAGNLDVELYNALADDIADGNKVKADTKLFTLDDPNLWEPGAVVYENFTVTNEGTLALKYKLSVNIANATGAKNLADVLKVGVVEGGVDVATREEALAKVTSWMPFASFVEEGELQAKAAGATAYPSDTYGVVIWWEPSDKDNDYNMNNDYTDADQLKIEIGVNLFATQLEAENDSFGNDYDADAPVVTYKADPSNVQDYLDGKYGSTTNMKLVLAAGNYGVLNLGRPTKYVGSNTTYICSDGNSHSGIVFETADAEEFKAHLADNKWHTTPKYITTLENLMIVGEDGANVAGLVFSTGHSYGDVYDYVRDIDYTSGSAYYSTAYISNVTVENIAFTGQANICTSDAATVVDGVTFRDCSFTTGGTASANGAAIRYYNEANNGNIKNLTVENCEFTNCYQGIYAANVNGVSILGNTFDTLGHNAIALQGGEAVNLKAVVIKNNVIKNVTDRVIRFNHIGADSQITIQYNAAVNSGNDADEVIKASSIADGATFDVKYNDWDGKIVVNDQLKDAANTEASYAADNTGLNDALSSGADTIILGSGEYIIPDSAKGKTLTIVGNGDTVVASQDDGAAEGDCDYSFDGSTVTFENVTITTSTTYFPGYARMKGIYNNCTINGVWTLYDNSEFNNCTFNVTGDVYNVWTWGAAEATFNNCTFNNDGKAILLYGTANTKLTVNGCTFNDNGGLADLKAAIEIGNDYNKSYELIVNNTVVNGYEINDKGISTGTTLWANKNSMGTDKLNVVVNGVDVY